MALLLFSGNTLFAGYIFHVMSQHWRTSFSVLWSKIMTNLESFVSCNCRGVRQMLSVFLWKILKLNFDKNKLLLSAAVIIKPMWLFLFYWSLFHSLCSHVKRVTRFPLNFTPIVSHSEYHVSTSVYVSVICTSDWITVWFCSLSNFWCQEKFSLI